KHLGAIKSLMSTIGIFATSLSPILVGSLLDLDIGFATQMKFYAAILLVIAVISKIGCWQISHTTPSS
ncbi:MAG: hypothetical protein HOI66_02915, partial [Verrucomicrobia bacterium]|nr:hypothetical protein [Verrucomicrobiota bacterium]